MPVDRIDHFAGMRGEAAPKEVAPKGAPTVTPELVEWLEREFPVQVIGPANSMDEAAMKLSMLGTQFGEQRVLAYLKLLMRSE